MLVKVGKKHIILFAMEKKKPFNTKTIALVGMLTAIEIVLQLLSYIIPSAVNINLSLIPIAIGAIIGGPTVGAFLGFASGVIVLVSPNTVTLFMAMSPVGTIITCLTKTTIAGLVAGFIAKALKKHDIVGSILASFVVPVINTGMFIIFALLFFSEWIGGAIAALLGINFLFEVVSTMLIGPTLYKILAKAIPNKNLD